MLVALVVFTLVGHPSVLLPANWRGGSLVYLALIYPVVWHFLLRARALNGHAPDRPDRVLGAIGLSSLLLAIAAISVAIGFTAPGRSSELTQYLDLVGRVFLVVALRSPALHGGGRPRRCRVGREPGRAREASTSQSPGP